MLGSVSLSRFVQGRELVIPSYPLSALFYTCLCIIFSLVCLLLHPDSVWAIYKFAFFLPYFMHSFIHVWSSPSSSVGVYSIADECHIHASRFTHCDCTVNYFLAYFLRSWGPLRASSSLLSAFMFTDLDRVSHLSFLFLLISPLASVAAASADGAVLS